MKAVDRHRLILGAPAATPVQSQSCSRRTLWKAVAVGLTIIVVLAAFVNKSAAEIQSVQFFEGTGGLTQGEIDAIVKSRTHETRFRQDQAKFIYFVVYLTRPAAADMTLQWIWDGKQETGKSIVIPQGGKWVYGSWGREEPGYWALGRHTVEFWLGGKKGPTGEFDVEGYIPSLQARVVGLKFYRGPNQRMQPSGDSIQHLWDSLTPTNVFHRSENCIYWELQTKPSGLMWSRPTVNRLKIAVNLSMVTSRSAWRTADFPTRPEGGSDERDYRSTMCVEGGFWKERTGTYYLELWIDGQNVANGSLEILP